MGKMSMRVGNRLNSTIVRARMKRIAKTKTFTTKRQRTQKSTSGSSGQSISQLLSKLNANSGKTSSAEQLLANRTQTLLYSGMETAAERVEKRLGKFLKTDGTSVFDEEDETKLKENVADNIESFVNDYNYLMKRLAQYGDIVDSNYAKKLKNYANAENKELREIGITIKGDGTLELDENKLKAADISQVKKLFTGEDGFAKKVSNLSGQIGKYAKEKVTELEKSSAQASSNYNRYARYANNSQSYNSSYYNNSYYNSKA